METVEKLQQRKFLVFETRQKSKFSRLSQVGSSSTFLAELDSTEREQQQQQPQKEFAIQEEAYRKRIISPPDLYSFYIVSLYSGVLLY